jgi:hypothetical protein
MDRLAIGRLTASALLLASLGCASATDIAPPGQAAEVPAGAAAIGLVPFPDGTTQLARVNTGVTEHARLVLGDEVSWTALWGRVVTNLFPHPPAPAVDFGRNMVVAAAMGTRPSGGFAIAIDSAYSANGHIYVVVDESSPGDRCAVPMMITAPFAAVLLPRSSEPVLFVERAVVSRC